MTALIIIAIILFLIFLLLMTGVKVNVVSDENISVRAGIGPFMIKVYPTKKKKIRLRDFTQKKYLELLNSEKAGEKVPTPETKEKKANGSVAQTISLVRKILERLDIYVGRINAVLSHLDVVVGGGDSASAAVTYGVISQSVTYLLEILDCKTRLRIPHPEKLSVRCDYTADSITFALDLTIKIRLIDAVRTAFDVLMIKLEHDSEYKLNNNKYERKVGNENGRQQAERNNQDIS